MRLPHVDAMRGLAVLFMLILHTAHGWLAPQTHADPAWQFIRMTGGMGAPLFLLLAGVSLGMNWQRTDPQNRASRVRPDVGRGLQLVVLGYALRLQMWLLDGGGMTSLAAWRAEAPLLAAYVCLYLGLGRWGSRQGRSGPLLLGGISLFFLGILATASWYPHKLEGQLRVDVLQAIGGSLALASVLAGRLGALPGRPVLLVLLGVGAAWLTPLLRAYVPGPLPEGVAAYLAWWDPGEGRQPMARFPLFPWVSYVFVGAAVGGYWWRAAQAGRTNRAVLLTAAMGAAVAFLSYESLGHVRAAMYALPEAIQPLRVLHRLGAGLMLGGLCLAMSDRWLLLRPLHLLGRTSLLVYWVHLEFAFGTAAKPVRHALGLGGWAVGVVVLTAAMTLMAFFRLKLGKNPRKRASEEGSRGTAQL